MRRRDIILAIAGATAWPLAARAQQPAMPVVGLLATTSAGPLREPIVAFRRGLEEAGFVDGKNVAFEHRWGEGRYDRLPGLAADLVRRQVAAIVSIDGLPAAQAAKTATTTIPIVFFTGADPVQVGIVPNLHRPGGNITGVTTLNSEVTAKRLELLRDLAPGRNVVVQLANPTLAVGNDITLQQARAASEALELRLEIINASTDQELDTAFATAAGMRPAGMAISPDPFYVSRSGQLATLGLRHRVPTVFMYREFAAAGGLMSYGGHRLDAYRQVGLYTARVLKGEKPAELPVHQATKVELIVNLKSAKALGLEIPTTILVRADEVIE